MHPFSEPRDTEAQLDWRVSSLVAAAACAAIGLLECAKDYVMVQIQGTERPLLLVLRDQALWWVLWMLLMPGVIALGRRFRFDGGRWRSSTVIHTTLAIALSVGHIAAFGAAYFWAVGPTTWGPTLGRGISFLTARYLATDVVVYGAAIAVYYAFEYFARFQRTALEAAQAESRASRLQLNLAEARIHALRMELNPHFLFNALNSIASLVPSDAGKADTAIAALSSFLRASLTVTRGEETTLEDELRLVDAYLEIESLRFDWLTVDLDVPDALRSARVPAFVLQLLVENAIRHGLAPRRTPGRVHIAARRDGDQLELCVTDDGMGIGASSGDSSLGIGLQNVRARLAQLHGANSAFTLQPAIPHGTVATIRIPYRAFSSERTQISAGT